MSETTPKKRGRPKKNENLPLTPEAKYLQRGETEYGATELYKPGDNSRIIRHFMTVRQLPKVDLNDAEAVDARVWEYMQRCEEDDVKPSVEGLAIALKVSRETLNNWEHGTRRNNSGHVDTIKSARQMLNAITASNLQEGKVNPAAGIFLLKNNAGYTDQQQITLEARQQGIDAPQMDDVMQEYAMIEEPEE